MLQIDLTGIIRNRVKGWKGKLIPGFLLRSLEKVIHQEELNELLRVTHPKTGSDFAAALYDTMHLRIEVDGLDNLPAAGRFIFASNHPLGGLDGIGIVKVLGGIYGDDRIRVLVNDLLMHVAPLRTVFLPINKYGAQGRRAAADINKAYGSDKQIVVFPAGLVSRLDTDGIVRDLEWQKSFVQKAIQYKRDIIPVRFDGLNRPRFYRTAGWRKRLGLKVNIEQAMLPAELCAAHDKTFRLTFLPPVSHARLKQMTEAGKSPAAIAEALRRMLYLHKPEDQECVWI